MKNFMSALSKFDETKEANRTDERGVVMELNEENKEAMEDYVQ